MNATEDCLGAPGSWLAWKEGGTLFIRGVVRYPNNFSTARLSPDPKWTSDTGTPHFVLASRGLLAGHPAQRDDGPRSSTIHPGRRVMPQYLIEREIPGAGSMSGEQLRDASRHSNDVLAQLGPEIQWVHSYVAGDKIYCVYNAPSEDLIRSHAEKSGFPANRITPVSAVINPATAK
ncbi:DUF4242 domain-containing protein [Arenimonas sp. SCN 70-307]|uniref:DUF4242 domain-containing protein n=1 Tax=Arenimonas sp. SCN 70-307 TaxID=1660089 RepID=UPI0025C447DE|nr:DUF4242 domain-containing protein [Arenimonas sp. SCN 70-307]